MDAICPCRTISHRWLTGIRRYPPRPSPRCLNAINWKSSDPTRLAGQPNVFSGSFELTPPIQSSRTGQNSNGQRYGSRSTGPDAPRSKHIGLGTSMEYQLIFGGKGSARSLALPFLFFAMIFSSTYLLLGHCNAPFIDPHFSGLFLAASDRWL